MKAVLTEFNPELFSVDENLSGSIPDFLFKSSFSQGNFYLFVPLATFERPSFESQGD
jgi:hypothetical protein